MDYASRTDLLEIAVWGSLLAQGGGRGASSPGGDYGADVHDTLCETCGAAGVRGSSSMTRRMELDRILDDDRARPRG